MAATLGGLLQQSGFLAAVGLASCLWLGACSASETRVTVDPAVRYQTISGWEVESYLSEHTNADQAALVHFQDEVYDRAVNEIGVNRMRMDIRSGVEGTPGAWRRFDTKQIDYKTWRPLRYITVNDNDDPHVINWAGFDFEGFDQRVESSLLPLKRRLEARGEKLFVNVCYVAFTEQIPGGGPYHHGDPEEYAEFVLATYLHLRDKYGVVPDAWEVILEPDKNNIHWADGAVIGRAMVAAARRLRENGFTPRFIAPSTLDVAKAPRYFDEMAAVPGALADLDEVSYHRYVNATPANLAQIRRRADAHGLNTAQLEFWFGRATYAVLHEDLRDVRVSAWQGRALRDLFVINTADPVHPRVKLADDSRTNLQYFRYIRAGAVRVGARTREAALDPLAFINVNGAAVVEIKADRPGRVAIEGLPAGTYAVSYATKTRSHAAPGVQTIGAGGLVRGFIPAPGVLTIHDVRLTRPRPLAPT